MNQNGAPKIFELLAPGFVVWAGPLKWFRLDSVSRRSDLAKRPEAGSRERTVLAALSGMQLQTERMAAIRSSDHHKPG